MKNKVVVITGVSSGIGLATARKMINQDCIVFGTVRSESDGNRLQRNLGPGFRPLILDVTDPPAITRAVLLVAEWLEGDVLAMLVNNAGIAVSGPMEYITPEEMRYQMEVNVIGCMRITQAFLPLLKSRDTGQVPGKIIHISSVSGIFTTPFMGPYCASKHALEAMNDAWRRELSLYGIAVVSILPGPVKTEIWRKATEDQRAFPSGVYDPYLERRKEIIARRSKGAIEPEIIANLIWDIMAGNKTKARYIISKNKWLFTFLKLLPFRMGDKMIMNALKGK
jgi:NAD(P)-dependent dehydrogenase (short-subunit alcohol dehydrogenase family)